MSFSCPSAFLKLQTIYSIWFIKDISAKWTFLKDKVYIWEVACASLYVCQFGDIAQQPDPTDWQTFLQSHIDYLHLIWSKYHNSNLRFVASSWPSSELISDVIHWKNNVFQKNGTLIQLLNMCCKVQQSFVCAAVWLFDILCPNVSVGLSVNNW